MAALVGHRSVFSFSGASVMQTISFHPFPALASVSGGDLGEVLPKPWRIRSQKCTSLWVDLERPSSNFGGWSIPIYRRDVKRTAAINDVETYKDGLLLGFRDY